MRESKADWIKWVEPQQTKKGAVKLIRGVKKKKRIKNSKDSLADLGSSLSWLICVLKGSQQGDRERGKTSYKKNNDWKLS